MKLLFVILSCMLVSCYTTQAVKVVRNYDSMSKSELTKELKSYDSGDYDIAVEQKGGQIVVTSSVGGRVATSTVKQKTHYMQYVIAGVCLVILLAVVRFFIFK